MAVFAISLRIAEDPSADARLRSVVSAIRKCDVSGRTWSETTAFHIIEYVGTASILASYIKGMSDLSLDKDLLLVINLSQNAFKIVGSYTDDDIDILMKRR